MGWLAVAAFLGSPGGSFPFEDFSSPPAHRAQSALSVKEMLDEEGCHFIVSTRI